MIKLVINRRKWCRGRNGSALLTKQKTMCCLGFAARQDGLEPKDILSVGAPEDIDKHLLHKKIKNLPIIRKLLRKKGIRYDNTKTCNSLMSTNDCELIREKEREKEIKSLFKRIGVSVSFVK